MVTSSQGTNTSLSLFVVDFHSYSILLYSRDPFQTQTGRNNKAAGQKNMIVGQVGRATNVNFNTNNRGGTAVNQTQVLRYL